MTYDLIEPRLPRMAGAQLKIVTRLLESPVGAALGSTLLKQFGMPGLRATDVGDAPIAPLPVLAEPRNKSPATPDLDALADAPTETHGDFRFESVADLRAAYREGRTDPVEVAERALAACADAEAHDPPLRIFFAQDKDDVLAQAKASKARWAKGEPQGVFDGVPVAIKDEVDVAGYPTTLGTSFVADERGVANADGTAPARFRAAGAVLLGKANMTEVGIGPVGLQVHHGTARNPYDAARYTGGSSAGSGAAVAAGLCPVSLGADGGGSVRNPASFCGAVGLKATYGRVSEHGVPPVCWSVAHLGPLAGTARDCALGYATIAGVDEHDALTRSQPTPDLERVEEGDLQDVTLGVYSEWFDHAEAGVVRECRKMLAHLQSRGAQVKEIEIPELEALRVAHAVTIAAEMLASQAPYLERFRHRYQWDVRLLFANIERFAATDYVHAQRVRHRACERFTALLDDVDAVVTPTNACTAPVIQPDSKDGESDLTQISRAMRFVFPANMTGQPAITFPAGYDDDGLPVGFQVMGRAWEESLLLRLAVAAEDGCPRRRPGFWRSLLG